MIIDGEYMLDPFWTCGWCLYRNDEQRRDCRNCELPLTRSSESIEDELWNACGSCRGRGEIRIPRKPRPWDGGRVVSCTMCQGEGTRRGMVAYGAEDKGTPLWLQRVHERLEEYRKNEGPKRWT